MAHIIIQENDKKEESDANAVLKKKDDSDSEEEEQDNQQKEKGISNKKKKDKVCYQYPVQYSCCNYHVYLVNHDRSNVHGLSASSSDENCWTEADIYKAWCSWGKDGW